MKLPLKLAMMTAVAGLAAAALWPTNAIATINPSGDISPQVVGGRPATENYSFMVYVSGCTGSLIKANWAVTAKHCPTPGSVRVGSINRNSGGTVVRVIRAVTSPNNDIQLLQLGSSGRDGPASIPPP